MPVLIQPGSGKRIEVSEEAADLWRSLGYLDQEPKPTKRVTRRKKQEG